jgi:hypothetical protein
VKLTTRLASAEVKNGRSYTLLLLHGFIAWTGTTFYLDEGGGGIYYEIRALHQITFAEKPRHFDLLMSFANILILSHKFIGRVY